MADSKLFVRGKVSELKLELQADKKDRGYLKRKATLKKVVAGMTMGIDMSSLFMEVVHCLALPVLEIKKMCYLYLINYARLKPDMMPYALNPMIDDCNDRNPLIRALAIRTMSYIYLPDVTQALIDPLRHALKDSDPYVRKTATICVAKLYANDRKLVDREGFVNSLRDLLADSNPTVVSNCVAALIEISERSDNIQLRLNATIAFKLVNAMSECSEWGQTYILESLMYYVPEEHQDAELLAERISVRLQHANSAVVLTTIKVILYLMNYMGSQDVIDSMCRRLSPPLVTLLSSGYEVQYVALRNILLIIQRRPTVLERNVKVFFCKYNDPIYVKLAKLEIIYRLADPRNVDQVLAELQEYASEIDVDFVRKAVRCIGRLAIKIDSAADRCIQTLVDLIATKVNYVVQEAVVVIKDIFRRYPNRYEGVIAELCKHLDVLDTPEAKASMIWIIGQYADRIENSAQLLQDFLETFLEEAVEVQLALLTATVKLFVMRPTAGQDLVPQVLKWATEEVDNPDLRDRGFIYWRLLSTDPAATKGIVLAEKPAITTESESMDRNVLDRLLLHTGTLSSIYHQAPESFIRDSKPKTLHSSPALDPEAKRSFIDSLNLPKQTPPEHIELDSSYSTAPALPPKPSTYLGGTRQNSDSPAPTEDDEDTFAEIAGSSNDPYTSLGARFSQNGLGKQFALDEEDESEEMDPEGEMPILDR